MRNTNERKMLWAIPPPKDRSLLKTHPKRLVCSQTGAHLWENKARNGSWEDERSRKGSFHVVEGREETWTLSGRVIVKEKMKKDQK